MYSGLGAHIQAGSAAVVDDPFEPGYKLEEQVWSEGSQGGHRAAPAEAVRVQDHNVLRITGTCISNILQASNKDDWCVGVALPLKETSCGRRVLSRAQFIAIGLAQIDSEYLAVHSRYTARRHLDLHLCLASWPR